MGNRLPKHVLVGSTKVKVRRSRRDEDNAFKQLNGCFDPSAAEIVINRRLPHEMAFMTLLHEVAHSALDVGGCLFLLSEHGDRMNMEEAEEIVVRTGFMPFVGALRSMGCLTLPGAE